MDIKHLRESTEKIIAMLDIYQKIAKKASPDSISLSADRYKIEYIKEKLLLNVLDNKKICEELIRRIGKK